MSILLQLFCTAVDKSIKIFIYSPIRDFIKEIFMEPVKVDQILCCDTCGVELKVIKDCDETCVCNITCCGQSMKLKEGADKQES
jgi:hypothetical protein